MAMLPPPIIPSFSLRVQLFAPTSYGAGDEPVRQFRVIIDPSTTIRDFCQEASRIHEINYGEPLVIKKVQDSERFDITQTELVGSLFTTQSTIRVIQASTHPGIRDSVPPTSALRFDPSSIIGQKRGREVSPKTNGVPLPAQQPPKRQRVSDLHPDRPIQSREDEQQGGFSNGYAADIIPDSQGSVILGATEGRFNSLRQVSPRLLAIPETPPLLSSVCIYPLKKTNTDPYRSKPIHRLSNPDLIGTQDVSGRDRDYLPNEKRSASYHIHRPADGGRSVSTAATSPLSTEFQTAGESSTYKRRMVTEPLNNPRTSQDNRDKSGNDADPYDDIASDLEGPRIMRNKKASLQNRSPHTGRGLDYKTPPYGQRRSHDSSDTPGELPLTPNSKGREQRRKERQDSEAVSTARRAAAIAAQERQRVAERAREVEEAEAEEERRREQQRAEREEQERFEVEEFNKNETERIARLKEEQEARRRQQSEEKRNAQEARRAERAKKAEEQEAKRLEEELKKAEAERERQQQEQEAKQKQEAEGKRITQENGQAEKNVMRGSKVQSQLEQVRAEVIAEEEDNIETIASSPPEDPRRSKNLSPELPRTKAFVRASSSTGFFPPGRRSALKQAGKSSSPATPRLTSAGVGIETQMPLPPSAQRRVSFESTEEARPVRFSPAVVVPPRTPNPITTKSTTPQPTPASTVKSSTSKSTSKSTILPPKPAYKRIVPPAPKFQKVPSERASPSVNQNAEASKRSSSQAAQRKSSPAIAQVVISSSLKGKLNLLSTTQSKSKTPPAKKSSPAKELLEVPEEIVKKLGSEISASGSSDDETQVPVKTKKRQLKPKSRPSAKKAPAKVQDADEDSEEHYPLKPIQPVTRSRRRSPAKPAQDAEEAELEAEYQRERAAAKFACEQEELKAQQSEEPDEADVETASQHSSIRDSRSPVVYGQYEQEQHSRQIEESPIPDSDEESNKMDLNPLPPSTSFQVIEAQEQPGASISSAEEDSDEGDDQDLTIRGSNVKVEQQRPALAKAVDSQVDDSGVNKTSKPRSPLGTDLSTQQEIDDQLTSSIYEASIHTPSSPVLTVSRPPMRPKVASLQSMNLNKKTFSSPQTKSTQDGGKSKQSQRLSILQNAEGSDEESDEDSDDDSDDSESSTSLPSNHVMPRSTQVEESGSEYGSSDSEDDKPGTASNLQLSLKAKLAQAKKQLKGSKATQLS